MTDAIISALFLFVHASNVGWRGLLNA
jgi:hypothetical protein